jgi:HSP20 family protein
MSKLTRWDPVRELDEFFGRYSPFLQRGREPVAAGMQWAPVADISETDDAYVIKADLPGVKKEDVKIELGDGVLMLSGQRGDDPPAEAQAEAGLAQADPGEVGSPGMNSLLHSPS